MTGSPVRADRAAARRPGTWRRLALWGGLAAALALVPGAEADPGCSGNLICGPPCTLAWKEETPLVTCVGHVPLGGAGGVPRAVLPFGLATSPGCGTVRWDWEPVEVPNPLTLPGNPTGPLSYVPKVSRAPDPHHCQVWMGLVVGSLLLGKP